MSANAPTSNKQQGSSQQGYSSSSGDVSVATIDVTNIKSIQLADGWHNIQNCELTQFAVSQSKPFALYPSLKYRNAEGKTCYTEIKHVLSFSEEMQSNTSD